MAARMSTASIRAALYGHDRMRRPARGANRVATHPSQLPPEHRAGVGTVVVVIVERPAPSGRSGAASRGAGRRRSQGTPCGA